MTGIDEGKLKNFMKQVKFKLIHSVIHSTNMHLETLMCQALC